MGDSVHTVPFLVFGPDEDRRSLMVYHRLKLLWCVHELNQRFLENTFQSNLLSWLSVMRAFWGTLRPISTGSISGSRIAVVADVAGVLTTVGAIFSVSLFNKSQTPVAKLLILCHDGRDWSRRISMWISKPPLDHHPYLRTSSSTHLGIDMISHLASR